jgi:hypothetical protein
VNRCPRSAPGDAAMVRTQHPLIIHGEPSENINADAAVVAMPVSACRSDSAKPSTRWDLTAIDAALTIAAAKNTPGRDGP